MDIGQASLPASGGELGSPQYADALSRDRNPSPQRGRKFDSAWKDQIRSSGEGRSKQRYYTGNYTHGDIEVFNRRGDHLATIDAIQGDRTKPPVSGRTLRVS